MYTICTISPTIICLLFLLLLPPTVTTIRFFFFFVQFIFYEKFCAAFWDLCCREVLFNIWGMTLLQNGQIHPLFLAHTHTCDNFTSKSDFSGFIWIRGCSGRALVVKGCLTPQLQPSSLTTGPPSFTSCFISSRQSCGSEPRSRFSLDWQAEPRARSRTPGGFPASIVEQGRWTRLRHYLYMSQQVYFAR